MTCSRSALPPTSCNTLGNWDLSLVPLPAAIMAMAILGAEEDFDSGVRGGLTRTAGAATERLPCDFFIRLQYTLPASPMTICSLEAQRLQAQASVDRQNLASDELRCGSKEQNCRADFFPAPIA